jgi:hypothetical protein
MKRKSTIIGLGSPLLDICSEVKIDFLQKFEYTLKNTFIAETDAPIYDDLMKLPNLKKVAGG